MVDLDREFRDLDRIAAPDLSEELKQATAADPSPERAAPRLSSGHRLMVVVVSFAVFAAAGAFGLRTFERTRRTEASPSASIDPISAIPVGWTQLPPPPVMRPGAAELWTGQELLVWGGAAPKSNDYAPSAEGYAFDTLTGSWSSIPPAPIPGKYTRATWTGTEAIFLGVGTDPSSWQGEAFDPATQTWRVIAPTPLEPRYGAVVVWTGSDMIVVGGGKPGDPSNVNGAAYDPAADSWHQITDAPIGLNSASGVWTGTELIVFGSLLNGGNHAATRTAVGAAYDPASDTWRTIASSDLSPQAIAAVWLNDRMVAYDYGWKAESYLPSTNAWQPLPDLPFHDGECYPDGAVLGTQVFAFGCGEAATWSAGEDSWQEVHGGMTAATIEAKAGTYKLWRFATLVPAGEVLFFFAEGLTVEQSGAPCYGCSGSPTSFWVYRPGS